MKLVVVESPFGAADPNAKATNERYLNQALLDVYNRGEAPIASHAIGPRCLEDTDPEQRKLGIEAGFAWGVHADLVALYVDRGISPGMAAAVEHWREAGVPMVFRTLAGVEVPIEAGRCRANVLQNACICERKREEGHSRPDYPAIADCTQWSAE